MYGGNNIGRFSIYYTHRNQKIARLNFDEFIVCHHIHMCLSFYPMIRFAAKNVTVRSVRYAAKKITLCNYNYAPFTLHCSYITVRTT